MGVLYKYKGCPDGFMVFICGTTCVSMQQNGPVMRNTERKGSAVLQISPDRFEGPKTSILICSCFKRTQQILRVA